MKEKGMQLSIGSKKTTSNQQWHTNPPEALKKDQETQCGMAKGSYARDERKQRKCRYDDLIVVLNDKDRLIKWVMGEGLLPKSRLCSVCEGDMNHVNCDDRSDGFKWQCGRRINSKRHKVEMSIRAGSWFAKSKMTMEEFLKYTYWWCQDLN